MTISDSRADRLEAKIDELREAVQKLILIDERQIRQGERIGALEEKLAALEKDNVAIRARMDKWAWAGAGALAVVTTALGFLKH